MKDLRLTCDVAQPFPISFSHSKCGALRVVWSLSQISIYFPSSTRRAGRTKSAFMRCCDACLRFIASPTHAVTAAHEQPTTAGQIVVPTKVGGSPTRLRATPQNTKHFHPRVVTCWRQHVAMPASSFLSVHVRRTCVHSSTLTAQYGHTQRLSFEMRTHWDMISLLSTFTP